MAGRPSALSGLDNLVQLLEDAPVSCEIVVIGEMDAKPDDSWPAKTAAIELAAKLTTHLGRNVDWALAIGGLRLRALRASGVRLIRLALITDFVFIALSTLLGT